MCWACGKVDLRHPSIHYSQTHLIVNITQRNAISIVCASDKYYLAAVAFILSICVDLIRLSPNRGQRHMFSLHLQVISPHLFSIFRSQTSFVSGKHTHLPTCRSNLGSKASIMDRALHMQCDEKFRYWYTWTHWDTRKLKRDGGCSVAGSGER